MSDAKSKPAATTTGEPKPGYKTSELWLTVGVIAQHAAVSLGLVGTESDVQHAAGLLTTFLLALYLSAQYVLGRNKLKGVDAAGPQLADVAGRLARLLDRQQGAEK